MTTPGFLVSIGQHGKDWRAVVTSTADNKIAPIQEPTLALLLARVSKVIRKKQAHLAKFPLPEPSLIIAPNGNGVSTGAKIIAIAQGAVRRLLP